MSLTHDFASENKLEIVQDEGVGVLLNILKSSNSTTQLNLTVTGLLANLAEGMPTAAIKIVDEGAIPLLVNFLRYYNGEYSYYATSALTHLAACGPNIQAQIVKDGGLAPLFRIMEKGSVMEVKYAAETIEKLLKNEINKPVIKEKVNVINDVYNKAGLSITTKTQLKKLLEALK